ncbi:DUF84 family protein [Lentibacillus sediminis]|uniref:DUF84 family protein n=1 Tax=Lentibacillus sediminis TaxID=1940529 RepID=UPI000C1C339D|nr:DUF84 family protein [Lentibacillus sediminis]
MKLIIGSKNPTKINAVQEVFPEAEVTSLEVSSDVSPQPFSDEETRIGAINRAQKCAGSQQDTVGIGLEGGVMELDRVFYLCNWGALVAPDSKVFTASGAKIVLPEEFAAPLKNGVELGDLMDPYANKEGVRSKEGAIGIFTNGRISRQEMFSHVVSLLRGQWEYWGV